jgi:hypothetical protein
LLDPNSGVNHLDINIDQFDKIKYALKKVLCMNDGKSKEACKKLFEKAQKFVKLKEKDKKKKKKAA